MSDAKSTKPTADTMRLLDMTANIVSAYVSHNNLAASELPGLIESVHDRLSVLSRAQIAEEKTVLVPALPIAESLTDDYIFCLEDGKPFKSLKRHLRTKYELTPEQYREKWGLPHDYPMVAPNYAKERSSLAKKMGLGKASET